MSSFQHSASRRMMCSSRCARQYGSFLIMRAALLCYQTQMIEPSSSSAVYESSPETTVLDGLPQIGQLSRQTAAAASGAGVEDELPAGVCGNTCT